MSPKRFSTRFSRRSFLKKSAKLALGLGSQVYFQTRCSSQDDLLRIGYLPITDATPLLVAHALGYYEDEGLKLAPPLKIRGWSSLVETFLSGKVNFTHFLLPIPIWMRYSRNTPVKIVAWAHTNGSALTIARDSGIRSFSDLGGKTIAVPYWYSMHNVILQLGLRTVGLKAVIKDPSAKRAPDEVNLLILPPSEMPITMDSGKIDGFIVAEPFNAQSEEKFEAKILRFTGDMWKNHPCCTAVVHEPMIRDNPVMTQKIVNALVRAEAWILKNREETARILSQDGMKYLPVSEQVLRRVYLGYEYERYGQGVPQAIRHPEWEVSRIGFQPYPFPSASRFIFEQMQETLVEGDNRFLFRYEPEFIARDIIATDFVKNAIRDLGGPQVFPELDFTSPWTREEVIGI